MRHDLHPPLRLSVMLHFFAFPGLRAGGLPWYSVSAVAKSAAGIGVLNTTLATPDAPCVFFCVCALMHPFFGRRSCIRYAVRVMVAQAGASNEAPVSNVAGYANPVWATTSEIGVSGGSCMLITLETALMATVLNSPHSEFVFVFAAVSAMPACRCCAPPPPPNAPPASCWPAITCWPLLPACRSPRCAHESRHHYP